MITGLVLAAGLGSRYRAMTGQDKLSSPIPPSWPGEGTPVILATIAALATRLDQIVTFVRPDNDALIHLLKHHGHPYMEIQSNGLGQTLAQAVEQIPATTGWMVTLGDMPFIRPETVATLADGMKAETIIAPFCQGRTGHPVGFGCAFRSELLGLSGDKGGRSLFQMHPPTLIQTDDVGTITDIDGILGLTNP